MYLSDLKLEGEERLERDASIAGFGMSGDGGGGLLAPVSTPGHLEVAIKNAAIVAVAAPPALAPEVPQTLGLIVTPRPLELVFRAHCDLFDAGSYEPTDETRIGAGTDVHPSAIVAATGVVIGARCVIGPRAVVEAGTTIGDDVRLGPGVVLGSNGFEVREVRGRQRVVPHAGSVRIGHRVELQANTCVSRSLFHGATEIGDDSALDNLVHIAHNSSVGQRCKIAACAMIAGSVKIGDDVWIGPNATVSNGLSIGDGAFVSLGAVVTRDVKPGSRVTGHFALEHRQFMRAFRAFMGPSGD
jgi:UDP-3-O-[3-hydroxymyristoyl] glucosamine N-acyltransferase